MDMRCRILHLSVITISLSGALAAQDSPSLGDLARQQRQQKEQSKTAPDKTLKPVKVITNEEIPESHASVAAKSVGENHEKTSDVSTEPKMPAEHWKSQITVQKNQVATLQREIDELNESIRFAPADCVSGCVGWNERQREKQQRSERMQIQLDDQKRRLEDMQDSARKQGYGSSVYDP